MSAKTTDNILIRNTRPDDFDHAIALCREVYPSSPPWTREQLESHLEIFADGQFVAIEEGSSRVVGMASSLIVRWADYDHEENWRDFTDHGMFTNHDPEEGRTLYAAEVMVSPSIQGRGIGKKLYAARRELATRLALPRIRAGARLRGYGKYADGITAEQYVRKLVAGELGDPTLSFQLKQGFEVFDVVGGYLGHDPESLGWAALIEWINEKAARPEDYASRHHRLRRFDPQD